MNTKITMIIGFWHSTDPYICKCHWMEKKNPVNTLSTLSDKHVTARQWVWGVSIC